MRVLSLSTFDTRGGAARAALRMHLALLETGVEARMLVQFRDSDLDSIIGPISPLQRGIARLRPNLDSLIVSVYRNRDGGMFFPALVPRKLENKIAKVEPDIVHLHWISAGFFHFEAVRNFKVPLVWTMHDSWSFTGGCHVPYECRRYEQSCGKCPILGSAWRYDLSYWTLRRKKETIRRARPVVVSPSKWMLHRASLSTVLTDCRMEWIPNGVDLEFFRPRDKFVVRDLLGLPKDRKLILYGALNAMSDRNKGFRYLKDALKMLSRNPIAEQTDLLIFGASRPLGSSDLGFATYYVGNDVGDVGLSLYYASADVFVLPSIQENFPNTVLESLASGLPVVAFDACGTREMIEHKVDGYLATAYSADDLSRGIEWVIEDEARARMLGGAARAKAEREYSVGLMVERYRRLYQTLIGN